MTAADDAFRKALADKLAGLNFTPASAGPGFYQSMGAMPSQQQVQGQAQLQGGQMAGAGMMQGAPPMVGNVNMQPPQGQMSGGVMAQGSPPMAGNVMMQGPPPQAAPPPVMPVPKPMMAEQYVIKPGDTLSSLAKRFGTTVRALADKNGINNPNKIVAGKTITL